MVVCREKSLPKKEFLRGLGVFPGTPRHLLPVQVCCLVQCARDWGDPNKRGLGTSRRDAARVCKDRYTPSPYTEITRWFFEGRGFPNHESRITNHAHLRRLSLQQMVNLGADGLQISQLQIDDGIADVGDLVEVFESVDDHVTDHAGGDFFAAQFLQVGFNFADQVIDIRGRDGALGARHADALKQFVAVEFFAGARALDDQRRGEDRPFVGGEALFAVFAFTPAAHTSARVVGGVKYP